MRPISERKVQGVAVFDFDGTSIDGSVKEAKVSNTSDPATVGATILVNVTSAPVTITLNSTEDNTTVTNAAMTIQKLN